MFCIFFIEYHGHYTPVVSGQATSVAIGQEIGAVTIAPDGHFVYFISSGSSPFLLGTIYGVGQVI